MCPVNVRNLLQNSGNARTVPKIVPELVAVWSGEEVPMSRVRFLLAGLLCFLAVVLGTVKGQESTPGRRVVVPKPRFEVDVLVDGRPLTEYYSRGDIYIEALRGEEYEVRL
jgi:hypothetical protein